MKRKGEHPPTVIGECAVVIDRAKVDKQGASGSDRRHRGRGDEPEVVGFGSPCERLEEERGEIDLADLRRRMGESCAVLDLAPERVRHTGSFAPGTPSARNTAGASSGSVA